MEDESIEIITDPIESYEPAGTTKMLRPSDGRINHVAPENVQDYLDSELWQIAN